MGPSWELIKKLEILPLKSQHIFSLFLFVVNIKDFFMTNSENHNIYTRKSNNLHLPVVNYVPTRSSLLSYKTFNKLPIEIKKKSQEIQINLRKL